MSIGFLIWLVTTNLVNFAFYLAVTRVRFGWVKTIGAFLIGYCLPFALYLVALGPSARQDERGMADTFSYGFALCCAIWAVDVLVMSRGPLGRRVFAVLVCGGHQVGAFALGFLAMRHISPTWVGEIVASLIMAGMGAVLILRGIPMILTMDDPSGWHEQNLLASLTFVLLYVTGIWPAYVAAGDWRDIVRFLVANIFALFNIPLTLAIVGKNRGARLTRMLAANTRVLQSDLRVARASEEGARRLRHDVRHHMEVVRTFLREGCTDEALRYLDHAFAQEVLSPPSREHWCENALVDSILKVGSQRARAKGLEFQARARVSAIIGIADSDLVALLLNLIDNAVNGAAGGAVRVSVMEDREALRIGVVNRVAADFKLVDGLPCERPGIGIFSIRTEIEKYHGLFDYTLSDGELSARVMILQRAK